MPKTIDLISKASEMKKLTSLSQVTEGATIVLFDSDRNREEEHVVHSVRDSGTIAEQIRISNGDRLILTLHAIAGKSWAKNVNFSNV